MRLRELVTAWTLWVVGVLVSTYDCSLLGAALVTFPFTLLMGTTLFQVYLEGQENW